MTIPEFLDDIPLNDLLAQPLKVWCEKYSFSMGGLSIYLTDRYEKERNTIEYNNKVIWVNEYKDIECTGAWTKSNARLVSRKQRGDYEKNKLEVIINNEKLKQLELELEQRAITYKKYTIKRVGHCFIIRKEEDYLFIYETDSNGTIAKCKKYIDKLIKNK